MRRNQNNPIIIPGDFGRFKARGPHMIYNGAPSNWLGAGWAPTGDTIVCNTGSAGSNKTVPEVTNAEAHASTGDVRKIIFGFYEAFYQAYNGKASADRPANMRLTREDSTNPATGKVTRVYKATFTLDVSGYEVAAES